MSVNIGIIGLPKSGKTSIFNGLTKGKVSTASSAIKDVAAQVGMASVPDPRVAVLVAMFKPQRTVPAEVKYIDIGASVSSAKDEVISGQLLTQVSTVDVIVNVVRAFKDDSVPHVKATVDADRDIGIMDMELAFSDLSIIEKRQGRIEQSLKAAKPAMRPPIVKEQELLARIKPELEKGVPVREMGLTAEEVKLLSNYQFLTAKPLLIVLNIGEDQLSDVAALEKQFGEKYQKPHCRVIALCGKLEAELAQLDAQAAAQFRSDFGMGEVGLDRVVLISYDLLGLISFFTVGADEVKAWSITRGTDALHAAGKIHSDIERGFIRAEVIGYEALIKANGMAEAKKLGQLRLEGKTYIMQDGDCVNFLFNV